MTQTEQNNGLEGPEEMARMAIERNGLYRLLAAVFRHELTAELIQYLQTPDFIESLAGVGIKTDAIAALKTDAASLEELSLEYARLFVGPGKHVPPYESVHLNSAGGTLWGPETSSLKRFIEQSGFDYDENYHGLPDHLSVELEFMAHLTSLEAAFWQSKDSEKAINSLRFQAEFLTKHLGRWVDTFAKRVGELANLPVYQQLATLTDIFIAAESEEFSQIDELKIAAPCPA